MFLLSFKDLRTAVAKDAGLALTCVLFLLLPLVRVAYLEDSFISPKLALLQSVCVCLLGVLLWRSRKWYGEELLSPYARTMLRLLAAFLAIVVGSAFVGRSKPLATDGVVYLFSFLALAYALCLALRRPEHVAAILQCGIAAAILTALWTLHEDWTRHSGASRLIARLPDWRGYLAAGLGNSGHIAGFIGLFLPAAILQFLSAPRTRILLGACIAVMFAAQVITWSVGSTGSFVAACAIWCAIAWKPAQLGRLRWRRAGILLVLGVLALGFYLIPHPANPHAPSLWREAFGSQRWHEGGPTRLAIWLTTLHMIRFHPLLGIGAGNFTLEYVRQIVPAIVSSPELREYAGSYTNDAHNDYLQVWCESGIAALIVWLVVLWVSFRQVVRLLRSEELGGQMKLVLVSVGAGATVFALDGMMSFPMKLPAHFAAMMVFLVAPGAIAATASKPLLHSRSIEFPPSALDGEPENSTNYHKHRKLLQHFLIGLFLLLCAATVYHGRRVAAEFYLKSGRTAAEYPAEYLLSLETGAMSSSLLWSRADAQFLHASSELAQGGSPPAQSFAPAAGVHSNWIEAERLFRRALAWDPNYTNASSRLGSLLLLSGRNTEARDVFSYTLHSLEGVEIHERLGFASYLNGDKVPARKEWQTCRERRPQAAVYYDGLIAQTKK